MVCVWELGSPQCQGVEGDRPAGVVQLWAPGGHPLLLGPPCWARCDRSLDKPRTQGLTQGQSLCKLVGPGHGVGAKAGSALQAEMRFRSWAMREGCVCHT